MIVDENLEDAYKVKERNDYKKIAFFRRHILHRFN